MPHFRLLFFVIFLCATSLACTGSDWYLRHHVGHATQDDVVAEMGQPATKEALPDGGSRWVYHDHVSYATYLTYSNPDAEVCYTYDLTFDAGNILRSWNKSSKNCGAVN